MTPASANRSFLNAKLVPQVVSPTAPGKLNLLDAFTAHIREEEGWGPIRASEFANDQFDQMCEFLERHLRDWDSQGVPRPLAQTDQDHVFVAWPHEQFLRYSGLSERIDANFCELFEYIQSLNGRSFLVICALWLKCIGFRRILICDSGGDEGVDVLAVLEQGGLRSLIAVIQAKTAQKAITKGTIVAEYGKYRALKQTQKYIDYRRSLNVESGIEGNTWTYIVVANQPFDSRARTMSVKLGILLRSLHQISFDIAKNYLKADVESEVNRIVGSRNDAPKADLTRNFFDMLEI